MLPSLALSFMALLQGLQVFNMIKKKKVINSPYNGYSIEEVMKLESSLYMIQVGEDFFSIDNCYTFNKKKATEYYSQIYEDLLDLLYDGNAKEKADAIKAFKNFHVTSLRIH